MVNIVTVKSDASVWKHFTKDISITQKQSVNLLHESYVFILLFSTLKMRLQKMHPASLKNLVPKTVVKPGVSLSEATVSYEKLKTDKIGLQSGKYFSKHQG